jgi:hypothetical protein
MMRHPEEERLLRYADGEIAGREAVELREHLAACWECRTQLEEMQSTIGECVRYRRALKDGLVEPPPAPWFDIGLAMRQIDDEHAGQGWLNRAGQWLRAQMLTPRYWAPAVLALILVVVLVRQLVETPAAQAAELLRRAVAASDKQAAKPRRVQIRSQKYRVTRTLGLQAVSSKPAADEAPLEAMFKVAHYDWTDPLSPRSYLTWRDQLPQKTDAVTKISQPGNPEGSYFRIQTTTQSGELAAASLTLRAADLRAVEGTLVFRNQESVEMTELPAIPAPAADSGSLAPAAAGLRRHEAKQEDGVEPGATVSDELQVLAALRRVDADLDDPIDVTRDGATVRVSGVGIAARRQQELHQALDGLARVSLQFADPVVASSDSGRPAAVVSERPEVMQWQARLEKAAGGKAAFTQLADRALESSDRLMARVHALRRLAERFPVGVEAELSAGDKEVLRGLRRQHTAAVLEMAATLRRDVGGLLGGGGTGEGLALAGGWQAATEELFQTARGCDQWMGVVMAGAPAPESGDPVSRLARKLNQLAAQAQSYDMMK